MAGQGLTPMGYDERLRLRRVAAQARRAYPGPVGELIGREMATWDEFGYRFGSAGLMRKLVDHIEALANDEAPEAA